MKSVRKVIASALVMCMVFLISCSSVENTSESVANNTPGTMESEPGLSTAPSVPEGTSDGLTSASEESSDTTSETEITIDKTETSVVCGFTTLLKVTTTSASPISWTSSNSKVATVDEKGKVSGISAGSTMVTATSDGVTASCKVWVLFQDVTSSDDFWYVPIYYLVEKGIVKGFEKQTVFRPDDKCTRAQAVSFIWRINGSPKPKSSDCKFKDVKETDSFREAVIWCEEQKIVSGYDDGTFKPQNECTRAQAITFLWKSAGKPEPKINQTDLTDIKDSDYFYKAVLWATEKGIISSNKDKKFDPASGCLRRHMVTFLYKFDTMIKQSDKAQPIPTPVDKPTPTATPTATPTPKPVVKVTDAFRKVYNINGEPTLYHYPKVSISGVDTSTVNSQLKKDLKVDLQYDSDYKDWYGETVDYKYYITDNYISILAYLDDLETDFGDHKVYNISISTGEFVHGKELVAECGLTDEEFFDKVKEAFIKFGDGVNTTGKSAEECIKENLNRLSYKYIKPFISSKGHLCFEGEITCIDHMQEAYDTMLFDTANGKEIGGVTG